MINKVIYVCHEFGGKQENLDKVEELIKRLIEAYPNTFFISPLHTTGFLYHEVSYEKGMEYCITLLDMCDEMMTFGKRSMSKGCKIEKEYCGRYKIPIIDLDSDYIGKVAI